VIGSAPTSESNRRALLRAYRESGDLAARDRLIEDFLPVVRSLARRYAGRGEQVDDLEQVAAVALIRAIDGFDLDREVELMTYIFPTVSVSSSATFATACGRSPSHAASRSSTRACLGYSSSSPERSAAPRRSRS
jgi:RNA polymerase sigma-B factor